MCILQAQAAPPVNHIHAYFARYPQFNFQQDAPFLQEFGRLADSQRWNENSARRRKERKALQDAMVLQFNAMYGKDEKDLSAWQALCNALGVDPAPNSITQCRKVS